MTFQSASFTDTEKGEDTHSDVSGTHPDIVDDSDDLPQFLNRAYNYQELHSVPGTKSDEI